MTRLDWEKAKRRDVPKRNQPSTGKGLTNKQAKRLAALKRKLNEPYSGSGLTSLAAAREIRYAEARLGLKRGAQIPRDGKRKRQEPGVAADTWWWTPARFATSCASCGEPVPKGSTVAYNHHLREARCEVCADSQGLSPQLSAAARAQRRDAA